MREMFTNTNSGSAAPASRTFQQRKVMSPNLSYYHRQTSSLDLLKYYFSIFISLILYFTYWIYWIHSSHWIVKWKEEDSCKHTLLYVNEAQYLVLIIQITYLKNGHWYSNLIRIWALWCVETAHWYIKMKQREKYERKCCVREEKQRSVTVWCERRESPGPRADVLTGSVQVTSERTRSLQNRGMRPTTSIGAPRDHQSSPHSTLALYVSSQPTF